jgi:hypothetical protein
MLFCISGDLFLGYEVTNAAEKFHFRPACYRVYTHIVSIRLVGEINPRKKAKKTVLLRTSRPLRRSPPLQCSEMDLKNPPRKLKKPPLSFFLFLSGCAGNATQS